jgi:hypothetical protein
MNSDEAPPRLFTKVTAAQVNYDSDFVEYCVGQEQARLKAAGQTMSQAAVLAFRREVLRTMITGRPDLAMNLRTNNQLLFENQ